MSVTIPNSVTTIKYQAFNGCTGLSSVNIGNSVISIGAYAFRGCSNLSSVTIGNSVKVIEIAAFGGCTNLTSVNINDLAKWCEISFGNWGSNPLSFAHHLFLNGTEVFDLTIPNSVTSISDYAFIRCSGLTSATIPNSVISIGNFTFFDCTNLMRVTMPCSVISVGEQTFEGANVESLTFTGTGNCSLESLKGLTDNVKTLNVGSGITSLGNLNLTPSTVNSYAYNPPACTSGTFKKYNGALHVPPTSTLAYLTAEYWKNFTNINFDCAEVVSLNVNDAEILFRDELSLVATTTPSGNTLKWSSSNPSVATVDGNGKVKAVGLGECEIFAEMADNAAVYASCHIVVACPDIVLTLNQNNIVLNRIGEMFSLVATIDPDIGVAPIWESSDEKVATVDSNGVVTAVDVGECDIIATVLDKTATCHVVVTSGIVITLEGDKYSVQPNGILTLTPMFDPYATEITATSSDPNVAFVRVVAASNMPAIGDRMPVISNQRVQVIGIKEGVATLTIASVDGKATPATCLIEVRTVVKGDVNGDGVVSGADVTALYGFLLEGTTIGGDGDVNSDGVVSGADVTALYSILLTQ